MSKTIVTGVDSSQTALNAALAAAELTDAYGGKLHVFSAYRAGTSGAVWSRDAQRADAKAMNEAREAAEAASAEVADVIREKWPNLTVISSAREGFPADVLLTQAKELDADVIVVGNKRVQGLARVLGSIAKKVAAEARCDLHIVNTTNAR